MEPCPVQSVVFLDIFRFEKSSVGVKYTLTFVGEDKAFPICRDDLASGNFLQDYNWNLPAMVEKTRLMTLKGRFGTKKEE